MQGKKDQLSLIKLPIGTTIKHREELVRKTNVLTLQVLKENLTTYFSSRICQTRWGINDLHEPTDQ